VFIFATTESHKIPQTILSRCQHFTFRRISRREIADQLKRIAQGQEIAVDERSVALLARSADGSMRDALSLLDQAVAFGGKQVRVEDLMALLGSVSHESLREVVTAILEQDPARALRAIAVVQDCGSDLRVFCSELMEHIRNILVAKMVPNADDLIELAPEELAEIKVDASRLSVEQVQEIFRVFHQAEEGLRDSQHPWFLLEMAAVRASRLMIETTSGKTSAGPAQAGGAAQPRPASGNKNITSASRESANPDSLPIAPTHPAPAKTGAFPEAPARPAPAKTGAFPEAPTQPERPISPTLPKPAETGFGPVGQPPLPVTPAQPGRLPGQPPLPVTPAQPGRLPGQPPLPVTPARPGRLPGQPPLPLGPKPESVKGETPLSEKSLTGNAGWELNWETVVDRVHRDRPNLGAFLEETALVGIEHDTVTIGYPASAAASMKMILKEDYQRMILEACKAVAGRPVRLRVVTLPPAASTPTVAHERRRREEGTQQRLRQEVLANPLVQEALSVFSGEIKEVRSKDISSTESMVAGKQQV
jgi:DNA polymerase-3 subunit gamma/tau